MFLEFKVLIPMKIKISLGGSQFKLIRVNLNLGVNECHFFLQWDYINSYSLTLLEIRLMVLAASSNGIFGERPG